MRRSTKHKNEQNAYLNFDSIGVPSDSEMVAQFGSGSNWQKAMTEKWLLHIKENHAQCDLVILEGSVNLRIIKDAFTKLHAGDFEIILVHSEDSIRHQRLTKKRLQPELVNAEMDNWAKCLYNQALEENIKILDTSHITLEQAIGELQHMIETKPSYTPR